MSDFTIDITKLQVQPDGYLHNGTYWYRVAAILPGGGEVDLVNTLKVFAKYRLNSISIFWDEVPVAEAYRVYKREGADNDEGSLVISPPSYFHDNGLIEFNYG